MSPLKVAVASYSKMGSTKFLERRGFINLQFALNLFKRFYIFLDTWTKLICFVTVRLLPDPKTRMNVTLKSKQSVGLYSCQQFIWVILFSVLAHHPCNCAHDDYFCVVCSVHNEKSPFSSGKKQRSDRHFQKYFFIF